jgi:hypothetical protein
VVLILDVDFRGSIAFKRKKNQVCYVWQPVFPARFVQFLVAIKDFVPRIKSLAQNLYPVLLIIAASLTNFFAI